MADGSTTLELIIKAVDQTTDTVDKVSARLGGLGTTVTGIAEPFANLADAILQTDTVLVAAAGTIGVLAVNAASKFSTALTDLDRFLGEGEGAARDYAAQFTTLSTTYGISVNDIVQSTADWRAANFDINDSLELTKLALQFATAGQISAGEATENLKKLVAGLSLENENVIATTTRWGDVINQVADQSSSDFSDIAEAVGTLAPQFGTSGASLEEFVAIVSIASDLLLSGSEAATGLKTIMGQLATPTKDAQAALEDLGVVVGENGVTQDSFYAALSKIAAKWPELTTEQQRNAASVIVSSENTALFQNLMDKWPTVAQRAGDAVTNATGSMANEVQRALGTSEKSFQAFGQAINNLLIVIGTGLEPAAVDIGQGAQKIIEAFSGIAAQSEGPIADLFQYLQTWGADLENLFEQIAANLPEAFESLDFSGLIDAFGDLGDALEAFFEALFGEIDLTTVEGLSSALQTVINTVEALVRTTEGIVQAFEPFAAAIGETVRNFNELDEASKVEFGEFIGAMKAIVAAGPGIAAILIAIGQSGIDMARVIDGAFGIVKVGVNALQVAFDIMAAAILAPFAAIAKALLIVAEAAGTANSEFAGQLQTIIDVFNGVVANATRNGQELQDGWNQAVGNSSAELDKLEQNLNKGADGLQAFGQAAQDSGGSLADWQQDVEDAADGVTDALNAINDYDLQLPELDTGSWTENSDDLDLSEPLGKSKDAMTAWEGAADAAGFGTEQYAENVKKAAAEAEKLALEQSDLNAKTQDATNTQAGYVKTVENGVTVYKQYGSALSGAEGAVKKVGDATKETAKDINDATKIANDFKVKMEEIASNERIKMIEFAVELDIAKLQEDTKRIEAAFNSIDKTIESTTTILGDLYSLFGSAETEWDKAKIESWIREENQRRDAAIELQKKLIEAQIDEVKARSRALERGDALITVKGDGLQPQLEAFMWEILKAIQVQASADMQQFLLGIAT